ncbi:MAG: 50S ribosomal protein L10 [Planctomycetia bacterium]|nr:50S ribosomal protein L10 [Planctomycetia bacterium]
MSKYVKNLLADDLKQRWQGVGDLLLVSLVGINANANSALRKRLREKNIHLVMVKNSMARRASEGTPLSAAFEAMEGSLAAVWGGEDVVSLAKEVMRLAEDKQFAPFAPRGGVMDGAPLTGEQVQKVSKWPTRQEQLSILMGQILSPGANLASQLTSAGGALASQLKQKSEGGEEPPASADAAEAS